MKISKHSEAVAEKRLAKLAARVARRKAAGLYDTRKQPSWMPAKFKLESGIPVPEAHNGAREGNKHRYPFLDMKKGQSFKITTPSHAVTKEAQTRLSAVAASYNKRFKDRRYITRQVIGGVRVWRVK